MSEFWKSNAKKYCEYCKVWIADNKASIGIHEGGIKHKKNVSDKLEDIKKRSMEKKAEEKKMSASMAAIEKAALEAMKSDLSSNPSLRNQYGAAVKTPELPTTSIEKEKTEKKVPKKVAKTEDKQATKRKTDEPVSKIGKWQKIEEKKPEPIKTPGIIDLQLPTKSIGLKKFENVVQEKVIAETIPEPAPEPKKPDENKPKWRAFGEVEPEPEPKTEPIEPEPVIENAASSINVPQIKTEPEILNTPSNTTQIDASKIKQEETEKVPTLGSKSSKKEKSFSFKKPKKDSANLRNRNEDDD